MTTESQNKRILAHLSGEGNSLTALHALNMFGCFRLASRINELKRMGHIIKSETIELDNGKRVAKYTLVK